MYSILYIRLVKELCYVPVAREGRRAVAEGRDVALALVAAAEGLGRPVVVAPPRADVVLRRDQ